MAAVLETLVPKEDEVQAKTGEWYSLRIRPYRTLENVIEGVVITLTEQKGLQTSLRELEADRRLAVVIRDSNDAVTVQDLKGRILAWNPAAERMYGWSEAEALALNVRDLIPKGLHEEAIAGVQKIVRAGVPAPYRTQRITKDGRTLEVMLTASALLNAAGEIYAITTTERQLRD